MAWVAEFSRAGTVLPPATAWAADLASRLPSGSIAGSSSLVSALLAAKEQAARGLAILRSPPHAPAAGTLITAAGCLTVLPISSGMELEMNKFTLTEVLLAAISQVMIPSKGRSIQIVHDLPDEVMSEALYGDSLRLQQIISDFLLVSVNYSASGSLVEVSANLTKDRLSKNLQVLHLELRIKHTGGRVPEDLLSQMFGTEEITSEEGTSLIVCRKLLKLMNGDVQYLSEAGKSSFIISVELASVE